MLVRSNGRSCTNYRFFYIKNVNLENIRIVAKNLNLTMNEILDMTFKMIFPWKIHKHFFTDVFYEKNLK